MNLLNIENENYKEGILEQYKLYVELADKVSERRSNVNTFFLTANTFVLTIAGFNIFQAIKYSWLIMILGLILAFTWYFSLQSYKLLNSGKFAVIHEIERLLPLNLYSYEWNILGEGKNKKQYWPISHIEQIVPIAFGVMYIVFEFATIMEV